MTVERKVVWVGGYPSHYMRALHCALEKKYPKNIEFIYVDSSSSQRTYEQGVLPKASILLSKKTPWAIISLLLKVKPHSIIVAGHYPRVLIYAALWGFCLGKNVSYIADTNLLDVLRKKGFFLWLRRTIFKAYFSRMHSLLYVGSRTRDFYVWTCGLSTVKAKLKSLPYPELVSKTVDKTTQVRHDGLLHVLFIGRLAPVKAVDNLIKAISLLSSVSKSKVRLSIAGDGPVKPMLVQLVQDLNLGDVVEILGAVPSEQTLNLFREATILVLPSNHEPWGVVVSEAVASGLPVVAPFWVGAVADLVINGHTGLVINDNSPEEIAKAIEYFFKFPQEAIRMGEIARKLSNDGNWNLDGVIVAFSKIMYDLNVHPDPV